ncbi:unnamed protein product [Larinioides sclopetarius]|uniref:Uncharacterized protein n=1 Tax=Larinioides sclopetarius TaxID=280406 RepID=A0AAV2B294_9ARAC
MVVLLRLNWLLSCQLLVSNKTNTNLPCKFLAQQHSLPGQYPDPPQVVLGQFIYKTAMPGFQCKQDLARPAFPQNQKLTRPTLPSKQDVSHPTYLLKQQYSKLGSTTPSSPPCASPYSSVAFSVPQSAPPPLSTAVCSSTSLYSVVCSTTSNS